jgi:hypothetical protein
VGLGQQEYRTITRRQLVILDNGAFFVDTPGMRELGRLGFGFGITVMLINGKRTLEAFQESIKFLFGNFGKIVGLGLLSNLLMKALLGAILFHLLAGSIEIQRAVSETALQQTYLVLLDLMTHLMKVLSDPAAQLNAMLCIMKNQKFAE